MKKFYFLIFIISILAIDSCSDGRNAAHRKHHKSSDGQDKGYYKVGKAYEIAGTTYIPQEYLNYEEVGEASWYGDDFHGKKTANGEIYNMGDFTAAHRTLPLPSMVRITNLQNGKSAIVKVNDRGPFAKNRVIDVSQRVAEKLDFKNQGKTNVKIEFLENETRNLLTKLNLKIKN